MPRNGLALVVLLLAAGSAAAAESSPAPGRYCATGLPSIEIGPGRGVGIDLMDCPLATIAGGRVRARRCFGMGGAEVPYDVDLVVRPDGSLLHDGAVFTRRERGLCP